MTFTAPLALLALLLVPILFLLDRWRRRPRALEWPSLALWEKVADAAPAARRRVDATLWLEVAAVTLLAVAAAGPVLGGGAAARRVVVLVDTGRHMQARRDDGTTAAQATAAELSRLRAALAAQDEILRFEAGADLAQEAGALPDADLRVVATNRTGVDGPGLVVVGRAAHGHNLALDAVRVEDDRVWFAVATDGPARDVRVRVGDAERVVRTGAGEWAPFATTIEVLDDDNYDGDDRIALRRVAVGARDETGSPYVRAALFGAGTPARPGDDLVITRTGGAPLPGVVRGADCVARGIAAGLLWDACAWRDARARPGAGVLGHEAGALIAWTDPATLWLGPPVDRPWDDHGTLALLVERAKQKRARDLLAEGEVLVGAAAARPAPGLVDTRGADRPWDGRLPDAGGGPPRGTPWRTPLAAAAALVLAAYVIVRACA